MPLSELYLMSNGKFESVQQKNNTCSTDLSFIPDNDFDELVWENGQIMMQGQSVKAKNTSNSNTLPTYALPSQIFKPRDKDVRNGVNSKMGRFGRTDSAMNYFPLSVPSGEMRMSLDDDMVPWLNYHIDDSLQHDFCSDFLTESSGVTENELSMSQNNCSTIEKRSSYNQTLKHPHASSVNNGPRIEQRTVPKVVDGEVYKQKTSNLDTSFPSYKSRISDLNINDTRDLNGIQSPSSNYSSIKMPKQGPVLPNSSSSFINFSHFSRPTAMVKANHQNIGAVAGPSLPSVERIGSKDKGSVAYFDNPAELTVIDSSNGLRTKTSFDHQLITAPKPVDEPRVCEKSDSIRPVDASKNDKIQTAEPAVASSVCSVSSVDKNSNGPAHDLNDLKRKFRDTEDSDCPSDDIEEESIGAKKAAPARGGSGSKRSRAAEVHNLSERRRRDRINEKMRALQELIPNCNKVDKASMLDEAIEYLKMLQLQVQIMSMGAGMYMSPMMLPTGMQHMHVPHLAHISPMGMGMGMGMSFGMGMVDVNRGSPGYPVMQMPHIPGPHLRGQPISGPSNMHGMPGSNLFGLTGQGLAMPMQHSSMIPLSARPDMTIAVSSSQPGGHIRNMNSAQASSSKDPMQNSNLQVMQSTGTDNMINQMSCQEKNSAL